jgi:hypothetical protein
MLPPERGWCKSEFWAIADTGSVKSRARPDWREAEGRTAARTREMYWVRACQAAGRPGAPAQSGGAKPQGPRKALRAARGERSVNVSLTARVVGDTGIEPVTSSV